MINLRALKKLFLLAALATLPAHALDDVHSAKRLPGETSAQAEARYWTQLGGQVVRDGSAASSKKPFAELDTSAVPRYAYVPELFRDLRDERYLSEKSNPDFKRRLSWLYPHDGCWVRAALMKQLAHEWQQDQPFKLFIFGNLKVKTANAAGGSVSWWYHVIPVIRDTAGELWAIDPAIEPTRPLPIKEWIVTMVPKVEDAQFSLCAPNTYSPSSACLEPKSDEDQLAKLQIESFLTLEWRNLISLDRDPEQELGDSPPWSKQEDPDSLGKSASYAGPSVEN